MIPNNLITTMKTSSEKMLKRHMSTPLVEGRSLLEVLRMIDSGEMHNIEPDLIKEINLKLIKAVFDQNHLELVTLINVIPLKVRFMSPSLYKLAKSKILKEETPLKFISLLIKTIASVQRIKGLEADEITATIIYNTYGKRYSIGDFLAFFSGCVSGELISEYDRVDYKGITPTSLKKWFVNFNKKRNTSRRKFDIVRAEELKKEEKILRLKEKKLIDKRELEKSKHSVEEKILAYLAYDLLPLQTGLENKSHDDLIVIAQKRINQKKSEWKNKLQPIIESDKTILGEQRSVDDLLQIWLDEIEKEFKILPYDVIKKTINQLIENGKISDSQELVGVFFEQIYHFKYVTLDLDTLIEKICSILLKSFDNDYISYKIKRIKKDRIFLTAQRFKNQRARIWAKEFCYSILIQPKKIDTIH